MPVRSDFVDLSRKRLREAEILLEAEAYEGAFYLAGYAVELALKAVICKTMDIEIFNMNSDVSKPFMIHRTSQLIVWAGLSKKISDQASIDVDFQSAVNGFVNSPNNPENWKSWTEQARYNERPCPEADAKKFVKNVKIFTTWLANHW